MEEFRDERLSKIVSWMQAFCRGYLARKDYKKLQEQRLALVIVQRNLRKYLQLRTWPWWKLWQKIKPLLNATRIEDELAVSALSRPVFFPFYTTTRSAIVTSDILERLSNKNNDTKMKNLSRTGEFRVPRILHEMSTRRSRKYTWNRRREKKREEEAAAISNLIYRSSTLRVGLSLEFRSSSSTSVHSQSFSFPETRYRVYLHDP